MNSKGLNIVIKKIIYFVIYSLTICASLSLFPDRYNL